ncbi:hypothetical protein BKA65DRAFT_560359 [Rhexocercosporidium sp. MPI-PUGE-AT-0058]|nr:hypothetical protein BKA65DRAFT_560359 [Rhexocercosporidium sp. MPI-PUGE-AT-0058]
MSSSSLKSSSSTAVTAAPRTDNIKTKEPSLFAPQPVVTILIIISGSQPQQGNGPPTLMQALANTYKFIIHKNIICHHSPFFSAAFNSQFVEGQTQSMTLDDIDPVIFGSFVNWVYHQNVEADKGVKMGPEMLVKLWIVAERFIVPKLQNQAMNMLFQTLSDVGCEYNVSLVTKIIQESNSDILNDMLLSDLLCDERFTKLLG